jgi:hypothetical protein
MNNLLVSPGGFSDELTSRVGTAAKELGFFVGYLPGQSAPARSGEGEWLFRVASEPDPKELERYLERFSFDLSASTDDRPFFFYQDRIRTFFAALARPGTGHLVGQGLTVLSKVFAVTLALVLGCLVVPSAIARRRGTASTAGAAFDVAYVSCLGLGFLLIEVAFIQKLSLYLGQPTYTLAVVLSVLLFTSGVGAHLIPRRLASARPRGLAWFLAFTVALVGGIASSVGPILGALLGAPSFVRALAAAILIAPVGLVLGAPFPTGLTAVAVRAPDRIAWLWAVNVGARLGRRHHRVAPCGGDSDLHLRSRCLCGGGSALTARRPGAHRGKVTRVVDRP